MRERDRERRMIYSAIDDKPAIFLWLVLGNLGEGEHSFCHSLLDSKSVRIDVF